MATLSLSDCASRPVYTFNLRANAEWLAVAVKLPPEMEELPLDVLYRSRVHVHHGPFLMELPQTLPP
jgi:hypothetical protein